MTSKEADGARPSSLKVKGRSAVVYSRLGKLE